MNLPPGERDLTVLLASLEPALDPEIYVFAPLPDGESAPASAVAWFRESESTTLVLPETDASRLGLAAVYRCRRITLRAQSSLEAVGLLAAVCNALAEVGISVNAFSPIHHDHLFVPAHQAEAALARLQAPPFG